MAPDSRRVDHMLPVVGEPQFDQRFQERVSNPLFGPTPEANINGIPFAIALMHVAPGATNTHDVEHAIQKAPIVLRRSRPSAHVQTTAKAKLLPILHCSDRLVPILPPLERQS